MHTTKLGKPLQSFIQNQACIATRYVPHQVNSLLAKQVINATDIVWVIVDRNMQFKVREQLYD